MVATQTVTVEGMTELLEMLERIDEQTLLLDSLVYVKFGLWFLAGLVFGGCLIFAFRR